VGKYTALDDRIVEMIAYMRKNKVKRLVMAEDAIEIEFQDESPEGSFPLWSLGNSDDTAPDETSYYSLKLDADKDKGEN